MDKKIIMFDDTETGKYKFHQHKKAYFDRQYRDINKTVVSAVVSFSKKDFKYFIG